MPTQNNSTEPPDAVASQAGLGSKQNQTPVTIPSAAELRSNSRATIAALELQIAALKCGSRAHADILLVADNATLRTQNTALKAALEELLAVHDLDEHRTRKVMPCDTPLAQAAIANARQALAAAKGEKS